MDGASALVFDALLAEDHLQLAATLPAYPEEQSVGFVDVDTVEHHAPEMGRGSGRQA